MFEISKFKDADKEQWKKLWAGYEVNDATAEEIEKAVCSNWPKILSDENCHANALRLKESGLAVGFVTYIKHWCTSGDKDECYLYDLFVLLEHQGKGGGRMLIESVVDFAKEQGLNKITWLTMPDNKQAHILYDKFAKPVDWIRYKVELS